VAENALNRANHSIQGDPLFRAPSARKWPIMIVSGLSSHVSRICQEAINRHDLLTGMQGPCSRPSVRTASGDITIRHPREGRSRGADRPFCFFHLIRSLLKMYRCRLLRQIRPCIDPVLCQSSSRHLRCGLAAPSEVGDKLLEQIAIQRFREFESIAMRI
jgi:hypothetical protein